MIDFDYDHLSILSQSDIQLNYTPTTGRENKFNRLRVKI